MEDKAIFYWEEAKGVLEGEFNEVAMQTWISSLEPVTFNDEEIVLQTKNNFFKEIIERKYLATIAKVLRALTENNQDVRIISSEEENKTSLEALENLSTKSHIKQKYVFETFVRGKSNELAYAACVAVSDAPGKTSYNPLFLYGGVGLGKTHLMHSIGNRIMQAEPDTKILYCSSETFTNELINSIKERRNQAFRNKYRDIDVLLIDDIQFLSDKEGTQEEFFHTFNTLYEANKQIVISSDQPPRELKTLEDRLRSRFGAGLIVDITFPDFETRVAILEKKAEFDNVSVPKEVTNYIAKYVVSNIRELEGALNKVIALATLCKTPITIELTEKALRDLISEPDKPEISIQFIQEVVANFYNITSDDIRAKKRNQNIAYPRQIAMYLSRKLIDISLPKIGQSFGGRDHSTVIHACDKISSELEKDQNLNNVLIELEKKIKGE